MGAGQADEPTREMLRQAFDGMAQLVEFIDRDGAQVYANPSMLAMLDDSVTARLRRAQRAALECAEPTAGELEVSRDGETQIWTCTHIPLRDADGHLGGLCTIAMDETERGRVERELAQASGTLRSMVAATDDTVMLIDRDGRIQYINYTTPDLTPEGVIGKAIYDFVPAPMRDAMREAVARVLETEKPDSYKTTYVGDGVVSHWEARVFPVFADGAMPMMTVVAADVTGRRAREEEQERFFNISDDILCIIDPEGVFIRANPAVESVLGVTPDELVGTRFIDLVHPDDRAGTLAVFGAVTGGEVTTGEFLNRYRHADGSYRTLAWRGAVDPITGAAYGIGRDVTERLALEDKLRHAQKMEAVGQLAGGIAHDFNNIALSILLNAELGLRTGTADVVSKSFREIRDAAQRAADLTRQLLAFSRQTVANFELIDLNHIADGVLLLLRRLIPESIAVDFLRGAQLPAIRADRGQLEQVIMNLCLNARDAMPEGGRIEIETREVLVEEPDDGELPVGRHVLLSVTDTGAGIDPAILSRIFEPFFTTKPPGSGTGLGLATVYGVVQQHNAVIHVESQVGTGTTFRIHLPALDRRVRHHTDQQRFESVGGSETILFAEDEPLVRAVVVRTLTEAGYAVVVAADGVEAVEMARRQEAIDLVLLDMVMPNMSGNEAFERIRELRPDVRFLFSSGYVGELPRPVLGGEPVPLIRKPYRPEELLREIRKALDA